MANSPEYPDLAWMPPKSWTDANRSSVQLIVIHTTEGSRTGQSAEDGASYDQRRTDGTSTHYFHDSDSTIQCVRTEDQAHAARAQGNRRGIQHELCARTADSWSDLYHQSVLVQAARQCARDARKWDIPVRHLTIAQVAAGERGFCGHVDITYAFPQDNGTHTDPGPNFPWTQFLTMVRGFLHEGEPKMLVKQGDSGNDVQFWQYVLKDVGYDPGATDGDYGPTMAAAVAKFRSDRGVTQQYPYITGWTGWALLAAMMEKRAGRDGAVGPAGKDGKDGTLTGKLVITGGTLEATASP